MIDHNHPAVEAAAMTMYADEAELQGWSETWESEDERVRSSWRAYALEVLTAALPRLTADDLRNTPGGRELMAQTLRAAGRAAVSVEDGVPWDHDHDRATVAAWLDDLAESIHPGNPDAAKEGDQ